MGGPLIRLGVALATARVGRTLLHAYAGTLFLLSDGVAAMPGQPSVGPLCFPSLVFRSLRSVPASGVVVRGRAQVRARPCRTSAAAWSTAPAAPVRGRRPGRKGCDDTMPDTNAPAQPSETGRADDPDGGEAGSAEAQMRRALEQLGTRASPAPAGTNNRARNAAGATTPSRAAARPKVRARFARDGDVPVVRVPSQARSPGVTGQELAEERAARGRAEQALADARGTIGRLQDARTRLEQAAHAAQSVVAEREATIIDLRIELARVTKQRDAALAASAQAEAARKQAEAKPAQASPSRPEPVRWWLAPSRTPRP